MDSKPNFRDENLPLSARADALIAQMSFEEKISQLVNAADEITRLGVKEYNWWNEALHGVARAGEATVFPQAIALAAMFDPDLLYDIAAVIAEEARAKHNKFKEEDALGIYRGLTFWSPNINIFRDPRWGRGHETYGEDPYLTGRLGCAFVKGLQQTDGKHLKAAACAKHFAVHSGPEKGRSSFNAVVSPKDLWETYLPAFEELVREAGVEAVMGAYNAMNGTPCCANRALLVDILREKWGFEGHVVSDCGAIDHIYTAHKTVETPEEAAALALKNGCDLNCGHTYGYLIEAYEQDLVSETEVDTALRHLLRTQFRLGFFDAQVSYDSIPYSQNACDAHKQLCLEAAHRSIVLLKNDGILPLEKAKGQTVAVIGPNADSELALLGNYNGTPTQSSTVLRGMTEYLGAENIRYAAGCPLYGEDDPAELKKAANAAAEADIVVLVLGLDAKIEGEEGDTYNPDMGGDKADLQLPTAQKTLFDAVRTQGKPMIVVNMTGSAVALNDAQAHAAAVVNLWYPGEWGGLALAQLLYGEFSPSGRLPVTFYQSDGDLPDFADYAMQNRTYRYFRGEPLYPFGFGLSYSSFRYSDLQLTADGQGGAALQVCVSNEGERDAREVTQVYVTRQNAGALYPIRELKGVQSTLLAAGESKVLTFTLPVQAFSHVNESGERVNEMGHFTVSAGSCQPDERSRALGGGEVLLGEVVIGQG